MKEGSSKRHRAVWLFISGGVLIVAAIIALYTPWLGLFDIRQIVVTGNQQARTAELVSLAQLARGQTLFSVSTRRIERDLETHPWIKEAKVQRVLPHTVKFILTERRVVAWCRNDEDGSRIAIAEGGVIVGKDNDGPGAAVTEVVGAELTGRSAGDVLRNQDLAGLLEIVAAGVCGRRVERLDVTDLRSIELFLENDLHVRLGGLPGVRERLGELEALCQATELEGYERIDVRFGGEATLVPRKAVRR